MKKLFCVMTMSMVISSQTMASTSIKPINLNLTPQDLKVIPKTQSFVIKSVSSNNSPLVMEKHHSFKDNFILSFRAGTLGIGPELNYHPEYTHWGIRGGFYTYNFGLNNVYSSNNHINTTYEGYPASGYLKGHYDGFVKLLNGSLLGDYYPWKHSAFRLTTGFVINKNYITADGNYSASGTVSGNYNTVVSRDITEVIHGHTITRNISRNVSVPFSKDVNIPDVGQAKARGFYSPVDPYIGIGFNTKLAYGFYLNGDIGAMFQTYNRVNMSSNGYINNSKYGIKYVGEAHDKIAHYMHYAVPVYPVAMIGLGYRF